MAVNSIKPPLCLSASISSVTDDAVWTEDDGLGDMWLYSPYRWSIVMNILAPQPHSSHLTSTPYYFTCLDVEPGDWISEISSGKVFKIVSIDSSGTTETQLSCLIEDVDRLNQFMDPQQSGLGGPQFIGIDNSAVIFKIGKDGLPILVGISSISASITNPGWVGDVISNFRYRNILRDVWKVYQPGHNFAINDAVYLQSNGLFALADGLANSANRVVGHVSTTHMPGNDWFTIKPLASITTDITPTLPGLPGDLVYIDPTNPGKMTATRPNNGFCMPLYIKIDDTTGMTVDRNVLAPKTNYMAVSNPTSLDDTLSGYDVGSIWLNKVTNEVWCCTDDTQGAAVWQNLTGGGATTYKHVQATQALIWTVVHSKNSRDFTYSVYGSSNEPILPDELDIVDDNTIRFFFTAPQAGKATISFI